MQLLPVYKKVKYNHYRIPYNLTKDGTQRVVWSGKSIATLHATNFSLRFRDRQINNGQWKRVTNEAN